MLNETVYEWLDKKGYADRITEHTETIDTVEHHAHLLIIGAHSVAFLWTRFPNGTFLKIHFFPYSDIISRTPILIKSVDSFTIYYHISQDRYQHDDDR